MVSEAGLYALVLRSRKADARALKRWVTHEVLPEMRWIGSYSASDRLAREVELREGQPWFVAKDVCQCLGIDKPENAYAHLDPDERATFPITR
jgi:prophage antirepressor-like protein